jgi:hypothetical protein
MNNKEQSLIYKLYQKISSMKYDTYSTMIYLPRALNNVMPADNKNMIDKPLSPNEFKERLLSNFDEYLTLNYCNNPNIIHITLNEFKENYMNITVDQKYSEDEFLNTLTSELQDSSVCDNGVDFNVQFCLEYIKEVYPDNNELNEILDKLK